MNDIETANKEIRIELAKTELKRCGDDTHQVEDIANRYKNNIRLMKAIDLAITKGIEIGRKL